MSSPLLVQSCIYSLGHDGHTFGGKGGACLRVYDCGRVQTVDWGGVPDLDGGTHHEDAPGYRLSPESSCEVRRSSKDLMEAEEGGTTCAGLAIVSSARDGA